MKFTEEYDGQTNNNSIYADVFGWKNKSGRIG